MFEIQNCVVVVDRYVKMFTALDDVWTTVREYSGPVVVLMETWMPGMATLETSAVTATWPMVLIWTRAALTVDPEALQSMGTEHSPKKHSTNWPETPSPVAMIETR